MMARLFRSNKWHLFCALYMLATIAYIIYFARVHHIFMAGYLISTLSMLVIEIWIFATGRRKKEETE